jgi:hypothetical protein
MSENKGKTTNTHNTASIKLIGKEKQFDEKNKIFLEITNEGMDYLNQLKSNLLGIISIIGPQDSDKSSFANIIIGDKAAFDKSEETEGIYIWGQPIAHQDNTDLLVLDTENLYKQKNMNTSYDKQTFILSSLLSSIMIYNTNETLPDCINKFTNLAKESLACLKRIDGKELTPNELPLVYFVLHNINIDSNTVVSQFKNMVKDNIIFQNYFKNFKIVVLKKAGDYSKSFTTTSLAKTKTVVGVKLDDIGALDDQDYKQKAKLIKDQIMNDLEPKKINNCNIDGKCLFGLIQSFVDSLNKEENIILINQFNNVISLCLSDIVDQINFNFNAEKLKEKMASNTSFEETFLEICKVTFNDCINEQFDKFKSTPIVKISPSPSLFNGIKLIFRKCLDLLCENIQSSVDKKTKIINDISKKDYTIPNKLDGHNIEQLLYKLSNFISENILSPLYEPNNNKIQNNDKILQILKSKICETIEKISPLIQGQINKLIEDNKKIKTEFNNFKVNQQKLIQQKNEEINDLKLKTDKQDRLMKEKELENMTLINIEKEKYNQLEEKYNLEINEKNSHIRELTKNSNSLSQLTTTGGAAQDANNLEIMQLESLKNDYNDITNILVKYKMLVSKLINDKDFFFEDILIDKTIGDLRKKYPEIFGLLSEKESLENMKNYYDKQIEILRNENISLKEKNMNQTLEINESKEKLDEAYKTIDDKTTIIDSQTSMIKNKETLISGLENQNKEYDIRYKGKVKEMQDNYTKEKEMREQEYIREKQAYIREIGSLYEVIDGIFSRQRNKFDAALLNLSQDSQEKIKSGALNYKFK